MKVFSFVLILTVYTSGSLSAQLSGPMARLDTMHTQAMIGPLSEANRPTISHYADSVWTDTTKLSRNFCDIQKAYIRENELKSIQANAHDRARRNAGIANLERLLNALFDYCLTEVAAGKTILQYCDANDFPCPPPSLYKK